MNPPTLDGITYDAKRIEELREYLIKMRDEALKQACWDATVTLSHIIAALAFLRDYLVNEELTMEALRQSVKLQSHYAKLLNMHDGGERMQFASAEEWMARLAELKERNKTT